MIYLGQDHFGDLSNPSLSVHIGVILCWIQHSSGGSCKGSQNRWKQMDSTLRYKHTPQANSVCRFVNQHRALRPDHQNTHSEKVFGTYVWVWQVEQPLGARCRRAVNGLCTPSNRHHCRSSLAQFGLPNTAGFRHGLCRPAYIFRNRSLHHQEMHTCSDSHVIATCMCMGRCRRHSWEQHNFNIRVLLNHGLPPEKYSIPKSPIVMWHANQLEPQSRVRHREGGDSLEVAEQRPLPPPYGGD